MMFYDPTAKGAALLLMLLVVVLSIVSFLLADLNYSRLRTENQTQTMQALAHAKDALLGFAGTYAEHHKIKKPGYLLCPDKKGNGTAELSCGKQGNNVLGLFPWRTLGLPPLRDSSNECLWYAVSHTHKYNSKPANPPTSTSEGSLIVKKAMTGESVKAIAIIFAPGPPLAGQVREKATSVVCGSEKDKADIVSQAGHYLDTLAGTSNAEGALSNHTFIDAPINNRNFNDILLLITQDDFQPIYAQ